MSTPGNPGSAHVGISRQARRMDLSDSAKTVALVCGSSATDLDLERIDVDVILVKAAADLAARTVKEADAYMVVPSGLGLISSFLVQGLIARTAPIFWSFGLPLGESIAAMDKLDLPAGTVITGDTPDCGSGRCDLRPREFPHGVEGDAA
jgi:hypothetical protein